MTRWLVAAIATVVMTACSPTDDALMFEHPPDFASFDRAVQARFMTRLEALDRVRAAAGVSGYEIARAYGDLGHWYVVYGFPVLAERCYEAAAQVDPDEPRWPYFLGHVFASGSRTDDTLRAFEHAFERAPDVEVVRLRLAEAYRMAGRHARARALFDEVLVRAPTNAFALAGLGHLALTRNDYADAAAYFERALSVQPDASSLFYALAQAYRGLGQMDESVEMLARLEEENRRHIAIRVQDPWIQELGQVRDGVLHHVGEGKRARRAGRHALAVEHFRLGVAADDDNLDARLEMAVTLGDLGRYPAAMRELEEALRLFPGNARAHFFIGTFLLRQRRFTDAEAQLRVSLKLDPHNATVHFNLAQVLRASEQFVASVSHYAEARTLNPKMSRAAFWHAILRLRLGEPISSVAPLLEAACRDAPDNTDARALLARAHAVAGQVGAAWNVLDGRESAHVLWAESVAMVLAARGDRHGAVTWQRAALRAIEGVAEGTCSADVVRDRLALYAARGSAREAWRVSEVVCELPVNPPTSEGR